MKRRTPVKNNVSLHLPKPTLDAIVEFAKAGDISASTIVAALLAGHIDELRQLAAIAMKARGSGFAPLDEVYDLLAHLWMETALELAAATGDQSPWRTADEGLQTQWAEDVAVFKLRKRIHAMRRHEVPQT
jgi:hypothetical protein